MTRKIIPEKRVEKKQLIQAIEGKIAQSRQSLDDDIISSKKLSNIVNTSNIFGTPVDLLNEDMTTDIASVLQQERIRRLELKRNDVETQEAENYISKLIKLIPIEVISLYGMLAGVVSASSVDDDWKDYYVGGIIVLCLLGTILYLRSVWKVDEWVQIVISCVAFLAWAVAIDDVVLSGNYAILKQLIPAVVTFIIPLIPIKEKSDGPTPMTDNR